MKFKSSFYSLYHHRLINIRSRYKDIFIAFMPLTTFNRRYQFNSEEYNLKIAVVNTNNRTSVFEIRFMCSCLLWRFTTKFKSQNHDSMLSFKLSSLSPCFPLIYWKIFTWDGATSVQCCVSLRCMYCALTGFKICWGAINLNFNNRGNNNLVKSYPFKYYRRCGGNNSKDCSYILPRCIAKLIFWMKKWFRMHISIFSIQNTTESFWLNHCKL